MPHNETTQNLTVRDSANTYRCKYIAILKNTVGTLIPGQTNKKALKKIQSIRRRYIVHRFWLVYGGVICIHIK